MAQRILVFESDTDFAGELQTQFTNRGAAVEVVADGNHGLERAAAERPDLILLSIELPSMNGFLVCKKIKKNSDLKDIPLVILSSDANAEEIFEQHRKLRTRAEDYIRKPVTFDDLFGRVSELVPFDNGEVLHISDEVVVDDTDIRSANAVDEEIDAFTEDAFDSLVIGDDDEEDMEATTVGQLPPELQVAAQEAAARSNQPSAPPVEVDLDDVVEEVEVESEDVETHEEVSHIQAASPKAPPPPPSPPSADTSAFEAELEAKQRLIADLESELERARGRAAHTDVLEKEMSDLKAKAEKGGGISSREFLDLKERLNGKEREILDFKDQLTAQEKKLLELNDRNLAFERKNVELDEKHNELERAAIDASEQIQGLTADREAFKKREEDVKARLERAEGRASAVENELEGARAEHAEAMAQAEEAQSTVAARAAANHAAQVEDLREKQAAAIAEAQRQASEEVELLGQQNDEQLSALRAEHQSAVDTSTARHTAALESLKETHAGELATRLQELEEAKDHALEELRSGLTSEMQEKVSTSEARRQAEAAAAAEDKEASLTQLRAELEEARATEVQELHDKHGKELAVLGRKLTETETSLEASRAQFEESSAELAQANSSLEEGRMHLEAANNELSSTKATLSETSTELDSVSGQLTETQGQLVGVRGELTETQGHLEEATGELAQTKGTLSTRTDERDTARAELEAARTSIEELESVKRAQASEIATLSGDKEGLESRLTRAVAKVGADDEILERARKALAIGLGLLEDQTKNSLDG